MDIERLRRTLVTDERELKITDFGAGSRTGNSNKRSIKSIAHDVATPSKFSVLLSALIDYMDYKEVIELGTSLGLNTLYMSTNEQVKVTTFEGDSSLCEVAQNNFDALKRKNIKIIEGNIDDRLPIELANKKQIDLAYIDANHRYEPTLKYFDQILSKMSLNGLIILDDIHWSKGMWLAWNEIKRKPESILSIDIFEAGLVFINPELQAGHYTLKF